MSSGDGNNIWLTPALKLLIEWTARHHMIFAGAGRMVIFPTSEESGVHLTRGKNGRPECSRSVEEILPFDVEVSPYDDFIVCP